MVLVWNRAPLLLAVAACAALLLVDGASSQSISTEEFVGPFPSWRQVTCAGSDDTAMLQSELNNVGKPGNSPVLYINPGTCRITSQLVLQGRENISILGADPATTSIVWAGQPGGAMLWLNGVGHSRFGRLTWDGGGTAGKILDLRQDKAPGGFFATGNRHEDETFQNLASNGVAVMIGEGGTGDGETEWVREHFIGPMQAGMFLRNFNVLDHWVWDSEFRNVAYGVTNYVEGQSVGAGGYTVNRSNFLNNGLDMALANTNFFSSRWNYSNGSRQHVWQNPIGSAPSPWTSQGEVVINPAQAPFDFGDIGPVGLIDATIQGWTSPALRIKEGYSDAPGGDLWAIGNTFDDPNPAQYLAPAQFPGNGRTHVSVDDRPGSAVGDPGPIALPPAPQPSTAPVIEVQNGDIAAALDQAGADRAIVHIPYGQYTVQRTLEVGPNVTLTGDGWSATRLSAGGGVNPVVHIQGPSHAVLRDFSMNGDSRAAGVVIDNADQPGGLIHSEGWMGSRNQAAWDLANLQSTLVDLFDHQAAEDHPGVDLRVTNARAHVFNGAGSSSDTMYELHGGEVVSQTMYYESNIPTTIVAPGSSGTLVLDNGKLDARPGKLDTSSFSGLFSLIDMNAQANVSRTFGPNSLVVGLQFGRVESPSDDAQPTFTGAPFALWLPRLNDGKGGTRYAPEQMGGVDDPDQFLRDHLAPLRATVPASLAARDASVTDVRLYRLGGELMQGGVRVRGGSDS